MCDEYYDERTKKFWRALVGEDALEDKEEEIEPLDRPLAIEPVKPKPKMLLR